MQILLTNDDGVDSPGLSALREALITAGVTVTAVAPDGNRSARGHAITCREPLVLQRLSEPDDPNPVYSCSGMPADCARIGILTTGLWPRPDVVVSGINIGVNLGDDLNYSGTFHAAVEAALLGVPAVAFSQQPAVGGAPFMGHFVHEYEHSDYAARLVTAVGKSTVPDRALLNVNLPRVATPGKPPVLTRLGRRYISATIEPVRLDPRTWQLKPFATADFPEPRYDDAPGMDFGAVVAGRVSVSALKAPGFSDSQVSTWARIVVDSAGPVVDQ
ncbi:5'/3'-nucleotidase SurE [Mycobacterium sp. djl-10]|nr:5'/3'-nucleotidase SurE [Mycobacterium sp. djl-10]